MYALGGGGKLSLLTGVAGAGKTTLLSPLVDAWRDDGRRVVGMATAWRQTALLPAPRPSGRPRPACASAR
ncbi:hypothetical protein CH337_22590 [Rhodoblastus acidophilus]|nr:hypothetical protein CH337_22590 [Rhodoblastus acidophilus]